MLQRVQTIYMLASVVAILMMFLFPLASLQIPEATFELNAFGIVSVTESLHFDVMRWSLLILLIIMIVLPFITIFMYKRQKLQLRLLIYAAVIDLLFYGLYFLFELPACKETVLTMSNFQDVTVSGGLILYIMPILSFIACLMAIKGVLYDIALLSSADRLRTKRK